jgi:hypothetical protein
LQLADFDRTVRRASAPKPTAKRRHRQGRKAASISS